MQLIIKHFFISKIRHFLTNNYIPVIVKHDNLFSGTYLSQMGQVVQEQS
jgi:hypothetical protein